MKLLLRHIGLVLIVAFSLKGFSQVTVTPQALQYVACPNATVVLGVTVQSGTSVYWYTAQSGGTALNPSSSNTYTVTNVSPPQTFWVEPRVGSTAYARIPITISLSQGCGGTPVDCAVNGTLLFKENFGGNNPSDPDIKPTGIPQISSVYQYVTTPIGIAGYPVYSINKYSLPNGAWAAGWYRMDDHTYPSDITRGYMLQVNAAAEKGQFYEVQIDGLCSQSKLYFSVWLASILTTTGTHRTNQIFTLEDNLGTIIAQYYTGNIPDVSPTWKQYGFEFTIPNNITSLKLRILNNGEGTSGNDFVMDDIEVRLCSPPTITISDTICQNNPYKKGRFDIPADKLQTAGVFEFRDTISNPTGCDSIIILNLTVKKCCSVTQTTVIFKPDATKGQDTYIYMNQSGPCSAWQNTNNGSSPEITATTWTWNSGGCGTGIARSLIRFDELSTIPTNAVILNAKLKLYGMSFNVGGYFPQGNSCYLGTPYGASNQSFIQRVTNFWNEQTVTWNTQPNTDTSNQITIPQTTTQWNWNFTDSSANLLAMVQNWVTNSAANFGFMIKLETETIYRSLLFASSNHSNSALHPELIVTYEVREGNADTTILNEFICEGNTYNKNGFNVSVSGTYEQNWQNRFGCDSVVILKLTVVPPDDTTFISAEICEGERYTLNGFNISESGTYTQNLKNKFGCDSTVILNLTVNPTPDIEIIAITDNFCDKDSIILQIITNGDIFLWNTGSSENPLTVTKAGIYSATAFIENCSKTASYIIEECPCKIWLPNIFTPNGDGLNDEFFPIVHSTLHTFSMHIFDRWGQVIFKTNSYKSWDGTVRGRHAAAGVYFCVITYSCVSDPTKIHSKQGSVTLVR